MTSQNNFELRVPAPGAHADNDGWEGINLQGIIYSAGIALRGSIILFWCCGIEDNVICVCEFSVDAVLFT